MTTKGLCALAATAVALGFAAHYAGGGRASRAPSISGERIMPEFDVEKVAKIDIGGKVVLAAGDDGWVVETLQNYPADVSKIRENLMKLADLKVGQVVRGKTLSEKTRVEIADSAGAELASVTLGERHEKWGYGRYVEYTGEAGLTGEPRDMFGSDSKRWVETKIVDEPWISFNSLADPGLDEATLGFATGVVATVTVAGDTNRTVTVGNKVKDGTDRYLKLDGSKWIYVVPSYSVDKFLPKDDEKKDEAKPEEKPAAPAAAESGEPAATEEKPSA